MGWLDWLPWTRKDEQAQLAAAAVLPAGGERTAPDMADFMRQSWALNDLSGAGFLNLAALGTEVGPYTAPQHVPWEVLDAMGYDPVIYLGERAVSSVGADPELYYVRHDDPAIHAETEAWLWPLLPDLLSAILPAFAYGVAPLVLDWKAEDLTLKVDKGKGERAKNIRGHVHYSRAHSIWPGDVALRVDNSDRILSLVHGGLAYEGREADAMGNPLPRRAFLPIWDRRWGRWSGMASRRRGYKAWFTASMIALWQGRYLERSVDVPRIGYAPAKGKITVNGQEVPALRVLTAALMSLKNGSACVIPSEQGPNGEELWKIDKLELPDRSGVWTEALGYYDAKKLEACLMPPGIARGDDVLSSAKVADALMRDFVQGLADFAARELTVIVRAVHRLRYGARSAPPEVLANDVPQARRKILLEILKATIDAERKTKDGKVYTFAELIHPDLIKQLGVDVIPVSEAARDPSGSSAAGRPGRPRDATSEREGRREDARTDEGEDDTGGEDVDREERDV